MLISNTALLGQELQKSFNWDIILPDVQGTSISVPGIRVSPFVQGVSFGQYTMDDVNPVQHGALKAHSAGLLSIKEISVDFICPAFSLVFDYFEGWRSLIYDANALCYSLKSNYVNGGGGQPGLITFYDSASNPVYQWTLVNMFPKSFPNYKLTYDSQDVMKFTADFSVDFIQPNNSF